MTAQYIFLGEASPMKIILIIAIILLLFGGKKIPELMKGLGSGIKEFKNATKDDQPAESKPSNVSTDPIAPSNPANPVTPIVREEDETK